MFKIWILISYTCPFIMFNHVFEEHIHFNQKLDQRSYHISHHVTFWKLESKTKIFFFYWILEKSRLAHYLIVEFQLTFQNETWSKAIYTIDIPTIGYSFPTMKETMYCKVFSYFLLEFSLETSWFLNK